MTQNSPAMGAGASAANSVESVAWIAEGPGWLAVDKPSGLSVHNAPGQDLCSMLRDELTAQRERAAEIGFTPDFGVHPVHRLDKETSGILLLATGPVALRELGGRFQQGRVEKRYLALLHGRVPDTPDDGWHRWDWSLSRDAGGRKNPAGSGPRIECQTRVRPIEHSVHYSLVHCEPLTGRMHQIRRHAKLAGHPVVGDRRYGSPRAIRFLESRHQFYRLALHACRLSLILPGSTSVRVIESPDIPPEMARLLAADNGEGLEKEMHVGVDIA